MATLGSLLLGAVAYAVVLRVPGSSGITPGLGSAFLAPDAAAEGAVGRRLEDSDDGPPMGLIVAGVVLGLFLCCVAGAMRAVQPVSVLWAQAPDSPPPQASAVIFLDIDGVLHPHGVPHTSRLNPGPLSQLKRIVQTHDAHIVLSSTWRLQPKAVEEVSAVFKRVEIPLPISSTPHHIFGGRAQEIEHWLRERGQWVDSGRWIAIDDLRLTGPGKLAEANVVQTDPRVGLTTEMADEAINKLYNAKVVDSPVARALAHAAQRAQGDTTKGGEVLETVSV